MKEGERRASALSIYEIIRKTVKPIARISLSISAVEGVSYGYLKSAVKAILKLVAYART